MEELQPPGRNHLTSARTDGGLQEPQPLCLGLLSGCGSEGRGVVLCKQGREESGHNGVGKIAALPAVLTAGFLFLPRRLQIRA